MLISVEIVKHKIMSKTTLLDGLENIGTFHILAFCWVFFVVDTHFLDWLYKCFVSPTKNLFLRRQHNWIFKYSRSKGFLYWFIESHPTKNWHLTYTEVNLPAFFMWQVVLVLARPTQGWWSQFIQLMGKNDCSTILTHI